MEPSYARLVYAALSLAAADILVGVAVFVVKSRARRRYLTRAARMKRLNRLIEAADSDGLAREFAAAPDAVISHVRRLLEDLSPGPAPAAAIRRFLDSVDLRAYAGRRLTSRRLPLRIDAYLALGLSPDAEAQELLVEGLAAEGRTLGRLVALSRIARHPVDPDFEALVACVARSKERDRAKEVMALAALGPRLHAYFDRTTLPASEAGLRLYLMAARTRPSEADWEKLSSLAIGRDDEVGAQAAKVMADCYPSSRFLAEFGDRTEARFRKEAARLLGRSLSPEEVRALDPWFADPGLRAEGIAAASEILRYHPGGEGTFLGIVAEGDSVRGPCLSRAMEFRLSSILYHAELPLGPGIRAMVRCLLDGDRSGALLEALSVKLPPANRAAFVALLREELAPRPAASAYLARYISADLAADLGLPEPEKEEDRLQIPIKGGDKAFLAALVLVGLAIFPAAFAIVRARELPWLSGPELAYRFVFDFQFLFAFYTIAVNASYLVLLVLSVVKLRSQAMIWERDLVRLISGRGILPEISILAPAYNEERTIAESVHSLLSLAYPSYQVIVVNDGSHDGTLDVLVRAFGLEPSPLGLSREVKLASMPVRAIYRSASLPNLVVVDKANGGKADALNAALNFADGDYVCTIDADSVLDPHALSRAMLQAVASEREVVAMGGNIFPVNGCVVEHGHLQEISLPEEPLARFQTVEYLRSFVAGRLGWTLLDSLLIISGAFGLFKREAVMELGGYLTGKGAHRQETVGEDMEIVVRLTRRDREAGRRGKVDYAYNANCWTEVPETWSALRRQRDRWHRGLMEVLCFHRSMTFRPRYGTAGSVSMPYFFLFELIGPWLETLGYLVLVAALAFNLIDPIIPLTVFAVAVLFGILISVASIFLAERQILYFRTKEFFKLLAVAIVENFGYRQLTSMGRVWSNAQFFFVRKGWQKSARRGFAKEAAP